MKNDIVHKFFTLINSLFQTKDLPTTKLLEKILLIILYIFGILLWLRFLDYGQIREDRIDWADITFPRLQVLQQAMQQGEIPLYVAQEKGLKGETNFFLSVPDQILSPDILLLRFLELDQFIVIHILIFYSIGYWGLLLFRNKYSLSIIAFIPLFLLFNFNGHIVSHLSVGHLTWSSYFLLSFFFLYVFELFAEKSLDWKWVVKIAVLQFFIFLSGGYHFFFWIMLFLTILLLFHKTNRKIILLSIIFSFLISMFRILPAALLSRHLKLEFMFGFPTVERLLQGLYKAYYPTELVLDLAYWEYNFYLGILGMLFVTYFGFVYFKQQRKNEIFKLIIPAAVMLVLSLGNIYKPFFDTGLPFFSGERVSSRFIIMTLLLLIFVSAIQLQTYLNAVSNNYIKWGIVMGIFLMANDLIMHLSQWGIEKIIIASPVAENYVPLSLGVGYNQSYQNLLIIGAVISIATSVFLCVKLKLNTKSRSIDTA
ncbi:MAG: hypothetical protein CVU40_17315 [Chloroflexi bacterium HGW-Chloroflexi-2]|jgi:hypothetical protein|nr:MAG: hypothetical protein CVU40_17315 [Chloroflexi bacterium HGW-Chloroflexi-2]